MNWEIVAFWGFLTVVVVVVAWVGYLTRIETEKTIRQAIDRGVVTDGDMINKLKQAAGMPWRRRLIAWGIVTMFAGAGLAVFAFILSGQEPQSLRPLLGIAAIFGFVGLGLSVCGAWLGRPDGSESG